MNWPLKPRDPSATPALDGLVPSGMEQFTGSISGSYMKNDAWWFTQSTDGAIQEDMHRALTGGPGFRSNDQEIGAAIASQPWAGGVPLPDAGTMRRVQTTADLDNLFEQVRTARQADPKSFSGLPSSREEYEAEKDRRRNKELDDNVAMLGRGDNAVAKFLGEAVGSMTDEYSVLTLGFGSASKSLLRTMAIEGGINAAIEGVQVYRQQKLAEDLGREGPNAAAQIGTAFVGGAMFAGVIGGAARGLEYALGRSQGEAAQLAAVDAGFEGEAAVDVAEQAMRAGREPPGFDLPEVMPDAPEGWQAIRGGIFAGESGGDFDALFGFSNREGGPFAHIRITQMTVDQAIEFSRPDGEYGQWVKTQVGRTATPMGGYQVVGSTLRKAKEGLGLKGDETMTPDLQERIGQWIYRQQGTGAWEGYRGPDAGFTPGTPGRYAGDAGAARWEQSAEGQYYRFLEQEASDLIRPSMAVRDPVQIPSRFVEGDAPAGFAVPRGATALPAPEVDLPRLDVEGAVNNAGREAAARAYDPEAFRVLEASSGRAETYRRWLSELGGQQEADVSDIIDRLEARRADAVEAINTSHQGGRRQMRAELREIDAALAEARDLPRRGETRDMAQVRADLMAEDVRQRDMAPRIAEAYRRADALPRDLSPLADRVQARAEAAERAGDDYDGITYTLGRHDGPVGPIGDIRGVDPARFDDGASSPAIERADDALAADLASTGEAGPFGPILTEYAGNPQGAIDRLLADRTGDAIGALSHPDVGPIDLIYGRAPGNGVEGFGLAKIAVKHPEVMADLQGFISRLTKDGSKSGANRIILSDDGGRAVVRLDYDGQRKTWLMTAYEKNKLPGGSARTDTASPKALDDTASQSTGQAKDSASRTDFQSDLDTAGEALADARVKYADRAEETFSLDGTDTGPKVTLREILDDLDQDQSLLTSMTTCMLKGVPL